MKTLLRALALGTLGVGLLAGCGGSTAPEGSGGAGGGVGAEEGPRTIADLAQGERVRVLYAGTTMIAERVGDSLFALDIDATGGRILDDDEDVDDLILGGAWEPSVPWGFVVGSRGWGIVPWAFDLSTAEGGKWNDDRKEALRRALDDITAAAPGITFVPWDKSDVQYIAFRCTGGDDARNTSPIGAGKNIVRLSEYALGLKQNRFVPHHEIMHSLGVFHEQNRRDRDGWVRINYGNIEDCPADATSSDDCDGDSEAHNYDIESTARDFGEYNVTSIMQYPPGGAFCKPGLDCITQLKPKPPPVLIGNLSYLSEGDIELLNALYPPPTLEFVITRYIPYGVDSVLCTLAGVPDQMHIGWSLRGTIAAFAPGETSGASNTYAPDLWSAAPVPEVGATYTVQCSARDRMWYIHPYMPYPIVMTSSTENVTVVPQTPMCPPYCDPGLMAAIVTTIL